MNDTNKDIYLTREKVEEALENIKKNYRHMIPLEEWVDYFMGLRPHPFEKRSKEDKND